MFTQLPNPGLTLTTIGVCHCFYGLIVRRVSRPFLGIFRKGLIGQVKPSDDGGFWFQISGGFMITNGELLRLYIQDTQKPLPVSVAYGLIGMGCFGSLAYWNTTFHGFPLLMLQGLWMLYYTE